MTDDLLRQKLEMWQKKVTELEEEYEVTMVARGEAAREGDLRENAAYQMLTEKGEFISARIGETKKIIAELKSQLGEDLTEAA